MFVFYCLFQLKFTVLDYWGKNQWSTMTAESEKDTHKNGQLFFSTKRNCTLEMCFFPDFYLLFLPFFVKFSFYSQTKMTQRYDTEFHRFFFLFLIYNSRWSHTVIRNKSLWIVIIIAKWRDSPIAEYNAHFFLGNFDLRLSKNKIQLN